MSCLNKFARSGTAVLSCNRTLWRRTFFSKEQEQATSILMRSARKLEDDRSDTKDIFTAMYPDSQLCVHPFTQQPRISRFRLPTEQDMRAATEQDIVEKQGFSESCFNMHGAEVSAAIFTTTFRGKVQFHGSDVWLNSEQDVGQYLHQYRRIHHVSRLDLSGCDVVYEGLENIMRAGHVQTLLMNQCRRVDDFCVARICSSFSGSLRYLDLSSCPGITARGLHCLVHLRKLQFLKLEGFNHIKELPYICLLLTDQLPQLEIDGVDYMIPPPAAATDSSTSSQDSQTLSAHTTSHSNMTETHTQLT